MTVFPLNGCGRSAAGLAAALLLALWAGPAAAADPAAGQALAKQWCANCHAVEPGGVGSDRIPAFEAIAREHERTEEWLTAWLSVPHQSMPSFSLSRNEIADLVAYLESLR